MKIPGVSSSLNLLEFTAYAATLALVAVVAVVFEDIEEDSVFIREQQDARSALEKSGSQLSWEVTRKLVAASGFAGAISLLPDLNQDQFETLAASMSGSDTAVINVASIRDLIITHVYPLEANANLLGVSLADVPEQRRVAEQARIFGQTILQGPIQLLQGIEGFIVRSPVFFQVNGQEGGENEVFWGLISVVIDADRLFEEAGFTSLDESYEFAIRDIGGRPIRGNQSLFEGTNVQYDVPIATTRWQLAIVPKDGWVAHIPNLWLKRGYFILLAALGLLLARNLLRMQARHEAVSQRLRGAIEVLPDGFAIFDENDKLVMCNAQYKDIYAKSSEAMVPGNTFEQILKFGLERGQYPEATGRESTWLAQRLDQHQATFSQVEQKLEDGRWLRIIEQATPDGGRAGVRLDITDIKLNEIELETSNRQLRAALAARDAAELRFKDIADLSTEWFWEQDQEMRFTYLSSGMKRATGVDPEDVLGKRRGALSASEAGESVQEGLAAVTKAMTARETFTNCIYQGRNASGDAIWVKTSGQPYYGDNGQFLGYRGVAADVTPLYSALRKAQLADRSKTQFLNVISHELRTPLTILLGFNRFLTRPEILPSVKAVTSELERQKAGAATNAFLVVLDDVRTYASKMEVSGNQLLALISDMLDLARIESNTVRLKKERIDLQPKVQSVVEQMRPMAEAKGLVLQADVGDYAVKCDRTRLRQILNNLVGNAIKFTETGRIDISSKETDDAILVAVEDTGIGIPSDQLPSIFERFQQVDTSSTRAASGVGLGLSITRDLVVLQGGRLDVESTFGTGSRFTFSIPKWIEEGKENPN